MNKIAKTINIYLIAEMQRPDMTVPFAYLKPYIQNKMIKICPAEEVVEFTDVYLSSEFVTTDNEEEFIGIFGINLSVNIELTGTENDDYIVRINQLGEIEIELEVNLEDTDSYGEFIEVFENEEADLVVESIEDKENAEEFDIESVTAQVLDESAYSDSEIEEMLIDITDNWSEEHGQIETEFIEEYKRALDILEKHYNRVEALGEHDGQYLIDYMDPKENRLTEGTLELPFDRESAREFDRFMAEPQPKKTALNKLKAIFFDDILLDTIYDLDDETDIRETVKNRLIAILDSYDKDKSDFKIELDSNTRRILDNILANNYNNINEDLGDEEEPAWEITYDLPIMEALDTDESESADNKEIIHAPDAETAVKYAEQNARIKAKDDNRWDQAEIIGVQKQS